MLYALQDVGTVVVSPPNHCAYHLFLMFFYLLGTPAHPRTFSLSPFSLAFSCKFSILACKGVTY